jgi:hypothetical protein
VSNVYTNIIFTFAALYCAFQSSFIGAIAIGDLIRTTLGPKGMVSYFFMMLGIFLLLCMAASCCNKPKHQQLCRC